METTQYTRADGEGTAARRSRRWWRWPIGLAAVVVILRLTGMPEWLFYYPTPGPTPPPPTVRGAESVEFTSADGTRLHGWFLPAQTGPASEAATILHVHGNAGNIESHRWFTEHLPPAGLNVFIFDYRGYGQSEGRPRRREPLIEDTEAALEAILARPDVDRARVGMYAQSLGAGIGLNVMAERTEIRAAVLESPFTSWRDIAANAIGSDPPGPIARALTRLLIGDSHRPDEAIAVIDRPLLLLHGTADRIVPVSHSRRLASLAPQATLIELPGGRHNTLRDSHPEIDRRMIDFFHAQLGPPE